jgi:hypothetical protein
MVAIGHAGGALRSAVERMRALVRESVGHRKQLRFLSLIDALDQEFAKDAFSLESVQSGISRAKAIARKELNDDWAAMTKILNGFEILEQDAVRVHNQGR